MNALAAAKRSREQTAIRRDGKGHTWIFKLLEDEWRAVRTIDKHDENGDVMFYRIDDQKVIDAYDDWQPWGSGKRMDRGHRHTS